MFRVAYTLYTCIVWPVDFTHVLLLLLNDPVQSIAVHCGRLMGLLSCRQRTIYRTYLVNYLPPSLSPHPTSPVGKQSYSDVPTDLSRATLGQVAGRATSPNLAQVRLSPF